MARYPTPTETLTKQTPKQRAKAVLRVNEFIPGQVMLMPRDKANLQARGRKPLPPKRERAEHEATGPVSDLWTRCHYLPGDGDLFHQPVRPGADDHKQFKSLGACSAPTGGPL